MRTTCSLFACLILVGCNTSDKNPILKSSFEGQPSANFFHEFGPPSQVIPVEPETFGDRPGSTTTVDNKELYYYWSSINKKTAHQKRKASDPECQLALRTTAEGDIRWIEVLAEKDQAEAALVYCSSVVR